MNIVSFEHDELTGIGGVLTTVKRLNGELSKKGHNCTVITANPLNKLSQEIYDGFRIIRKKSYVDRYLYGLCPSVLRFVKHNIRRINPDIVHLNGIRTLYTPSLFSVLRSYEIPIVLSPYYERAGYNTLAGKYLFNAHNRIITNRILKRSNAVVVHADYTKQMLIEDFDVARAQIAVIPLGVDFLEVTASAERTRNKANECISLLSVGVLNEKKGVQFILLALNELIKMGINARATIVGDGDYKHTLLRLAKRLKLADAVTWLNHLPRHDLRQLFRESDMFLLVSREESYGIVVAEALAMGLPCIVSKRTALAEYVNEPGCFGIDYPPLPNDLARLIINIHNSNVQVGPFSGKIRLWDQVASDYERLYEKVLSL